MHRLFLGKENNQLGQRSKKLQKKWENNPYYICAFDGHKYISIIGSEKQGTKKSVKNIGLVQNSYDSPPESPTHCS